MDNKLVAKKTRYLKKCIIELNNFSKMTNKSFCENTKNSAAAQTYIFNAIQTVVFLAIHTLQKSNLPCPSNYNEIFETLSKNGKIESKNLESYSKILNLRNTLMYDYDQITDEVLYNEITEKLPIFTVFLKEISIKG